MFKFDFKASTRLTASTGFREQTADALEGAAIGAGPFVKPKQQPFGLSAPNSGTDAAATSNTRSEDHMSDLISDPKIHCFFNIRSYTKQVLLRFNKHKQPKGAAVESAFSSWSPRIRANVGNDAFLEDKDPIEF